MSQGRRGAEAAPAGEGHRAHKHSDAHAGSTPLRQLGVLAVGVVLTAVAWVYLVRAAIDFGAFALRGPVVAWLFSLGAALGAVVCLVLMLGLIGRGLRTLGFMSEYQPRRAGARRRR